MLTRVSQASVELWIMSRKEKWGIWYSSSYFSFRLLFLEINQRTLIFNFCSNIWTVLWPELKVRMPLFCAYVAFKSCDVRSVLGDINEHIYFKTWINNIISQTFSLDFDSGNAMSQASDKRYLIHIISYQQLLYHFFIIYTVFIHKPPAILITFI